MILILLMGRLLRVIISDRREIVAESLRKSVRMISLIRWQSQEHQTFTRFKLFMSSFLKIKNIPENTFKNYCFF